MLTITDRKVLKEQGVTLTGRNTTGLLSRAGPWWVTLHMRRCGVLQTTTNDRELNNTMC